MFFKKIRSFIVRAYGFTKRRLEKPKRLWPKEKAAKATCEIYKRFTGCDLDIKNPVLFTEKVQWYKIYYHHDDMERIVDKYLFKGYIKERLGEGYTIPLYGGWTNLSDLEADWASLPEEFCLKSNLQSQGNGIKIIHNKSEIDFKKLKKELREWLKPKNTLIDSHCHAYHSATPRILAEKYIPSLGEQLYDWKFFCFNGEPHCIYVSTSKFGDEFRHLSFYDTDWNMLPVKYGEHKSDYIEKPKHFDEMLKLSKQLSKGFPFIRVDFFESDEQFYIAEMTFYPGGGLTLYHPESFNREMGDKFILPKAE